MSDLDEPPAKVLKIDNIDGVTRVTEMPYTEPFDSVVRGVTDEESGIIEGGAEPEQEEWLSEGILTDDDYNPASQGTEEDRTDSQLGTEEEEHLDSTIDSEANTVESEAHLTDSGAQLANNGPNLDDTDASGAEEENLDHSEALTKSNVMMDIEVNVSMENGIQIMESEANLTMNETLKSDTLSKRIEHLIENLNDSESQTYTQSQSYTKSQTYTPNESYTPSQSYTKSQTYTPTQTYTQQPRTSNVRSGNASDIVIQRVITLNKNPTVKEIEAETVDQNIEETMKNLDRVKEDKTGDFERYFNKNSSVKTETKLNVESKQEQDDGNDTDDLLRMLGEDDSKSKKKLTKTVKDIRAAAGRDSSDDDDEFVFKDTNTIIKNLRVTRSALARKPAAQAPPEDVGDGDDETEVSGGEAETMQRMFGYTVKNVPRGPARLQDGAARPALMLHVVDRPRNVKYVRQYQNKRVVQTNGQSVLKPATPAVKSVPATKTPGYTVGVVKTPLSTSTKHPELKTSTSLKPKVTTQTVVKKNDARYELRNIKVESGNRKIEPGYIKTEPLNKNTESGNKKTEPGDIKTEPGNIKTEPGNIKTEPGNIKTEPGNIKTEPGNIKTMPGSTKSEASKTISSLFGKFKYTLGKMKIGGPDETDEGGDGGEILDEEESGLDEDEFAESEQATSHRVQRVMPPEAMDEDVASDAESVSQDGSIYDELPSSDSDDMVDWFTLDIRSERASDYIPLLGSKAKELLLEEKRRVGERLSTLKESHMALIASSKQQAATLRHATATLAELDDMLRAA